MRSIVFMMDLVQDVGVLREIIQLARRVTNDEIVILLSPRFAGFDKRQMWDGELKTLADELKIPIVDIENELDAYQFLSSRHGLLISGSESDVRSHAFTHGVFSAAPPSFLRITFQHGFECVGFMHNRAHDDAYGRNVRFNADIVACWSDPDGLGSVSASERPKAYMTGPPCALREPSARNPTGQSAFRGLICENLHSVRLKGDAIQAEFLACVRSLSKQVRAAHGQLVMRPHPTGQFVGNNASLEIDGLEISAPPIYRANLSAYSFAISAPSSVLIDLVYAGVPVAVWQDSNGTVDADNYGGLPVVNNAVECWDFAVRAFAHPEDLLANQATFLASKGFPTNVMKRITSLLTSSQQWPPDRSLQQLRPAV